MKNCKKIMIFGCPGSGKSTLSKWLSFNLQIPCFHNDKYYYERNWKPRSKEDFTQDICAIAGKDSYIIDGNCSRIMLEKKLNVDLVIYLDVPLLVCYWRVIKRRFFKDKTIDDRAEGCKEQLSWTFLKSMFAYKDKTEKRLNVLKIYYPNTHFIIISSEKDLENFKQIFNNYLN